MDVALQGKIKFDDDVTTSNTNSVMEEPEELSLPTIRFGSHEPVPIEVAYSYPLHISSPTRHSTIARVTKTVTRPSTCVVVDRVEVDEEVRPLSRDRG